MNLSGNLDSERERLIRWVMGLIISESRHFLRRKIRIMSSAHKASEEFNIAVRISASVAGVKQMSEGGAK